jgi:4-aminobutyrate--pyruvate transaminase
MAADLERLIVDAGPETIAGFLAEPVTGGGGCVVPPPTYHAEIQSVLAKYDVPFFADEVITGFCRTGNWFGSQTMGIDPSAMTLGKALSSAYQPIAALVVSGEIYQGMEKASDEVGSFAHGATYSGHPVASAVALKAIELMEQRDTLGHVQSVMPAFERRLRALEEHPLVGDVRVCGLMGAVELIADKKTKRMFDPVGSVALALFAAAQRHGLIVRSSPSGDTIAFCPPLIISDAEIGGMFDRFELALADVEAEVSSQRAAQA